MQPVTSLAMTAYTRGEGPRMPIVPAGVSREWMEKTTDRFAYRCLPLAIANQAGWFILNTHDLRVTWDGENALAGLKVDYSGGDAPFPAISHFGHGILSWRIPYLFRTAPGYNLLVRGPSNWPKEGIYPLEGLVETDWAVSTVTMNWKLTTPKRTVAFKQGEPICMVVPQRRGELESVLPSFKDIAKEPELNARHEEWLQSREQFLKDLDVPGSSARQTTWQKHYFHGGSPGGLQAPEHQTKLRLKSFS